MVFSLRDIVDMAMASPVTRISHLFPVTRTQSHSADPCLNIIFLPFKVHQPVPIHASRRITNFPREGNNFVDDPSNWSRSRRGFVEDYYDDEDEDEDDEAREDRSLDLFVRFIQIMFRKISRKARKAVRSVLPVTISTKLVRFSVNGVIILAFLWIMKAFLEVVCTLGSVVFVSILVIRGIWAGISYLQGSRNRTLNGFEDESHAWTGVRPAT